MLLRRNTAACLGFVMLIICASCLLPSKARSEVLVGSAISGSTGGRQVPGLHLGWNSKYIALSSLSTGVRTPVYYHSAYMVSAYYHWQTASFWYGELWSGIGLSNLYVARGYREHSSAPLHRESSRSHGPGIAVEWKFTPYTYFRMECLYGIRDYAAIQLVFQELAWGALGVRF